MSLFEHLVERALERARTVEPIIDPSPLGPPVLGPSEPTFEETAVEVPAARGHASVPVHAGNVAVPRSTPIVERGGPRSVAPLESAAPQLSGPRDAGPQAPILPITRPSSSPIAVERAPASVIVERQVEQRVERTRELVRESTATIEPRRTEPPLREVPAAPQRSRVDPQRTVVESAPTIAEPVRPLAPVRERAALASPATPARSEASSPRPLSAPAIESRRMQPPSEPTPTLRIEIGRVIVRAESPAQPQRAPASSTRPLTTLAEYLANRDRGSQ